MCGLALAVSKRGKGTGDYVYSLYTKQKHRGSQGFGFMTITDGKLTKIFRSKFAPAIESELKGDKSDIILFHHRLPTSTKNTIGTTHPIFVSNEALKHDYYFAHNGVISNAEFLKKKHNALGYVYTTEFSEQTKAVYLNGNEENLTSTTTVFNDSEALAIELARWIEGLDESVNTTGGAAFWGIQLEKGTNNVLNMYFGKNQGRDLCQFDNKNWYAVSSESGQNLEGMKLFTMNIETYLIEEKDLPIDEAKPVPKTVVTTPRHWDNDTRNLGFGAGERQTPLALPYASTLGRDDERDDSKGIPSPFHLPNAWYTYKEAIDTGLPLSEFFKTPDDLGVVKYVPMMHMGQLEQRVSLAEAMSGKVSDSGKNLIILDECITKLVENEDYINDIESCYERSYITEEAYTKKATSLETENEELMEKISSLGFEPDFYEERIDTARDLHDYSKSRKLEDGEMKDIRY